VVTGIQGSQRVAKLVGLADELIKAGTDVTAKLVKHAQTVP
jgi:hypothetical protein